MSEYILLCGLLQDKGKGNKNDIRQDNSGKQIYVQQVYNAQKYDYQNGLDFSYCR